MIISGVASSEAIDSSGEICSIEGMDISDCIDGKCYINFEHKSQADDLVGIVTFAKKIFDAKDCDDKDQKKFWEQTKLPFLYIKAQLFDKEDHPGAVCLAAIMRAFQKRGERIQMGFSVEGATLKRDGNKLEKTVIRKISATVRPCNKQAWADVLDDSKTENRFDKTENLRGKHYVFTEVDSAIFEDLDSSSDPISDLKKALDVLQKTLTAGMGNVAPSQLTGGAALAREDISGSQKNRIKAALRDWDRKRPLKETIKAALPEVGDSYLDHFTRIAEDLSLKKGLPAKLVRIGAKHSVHDFDDEDQKKLIEGVYFDPEKSMEGDENYNKNLYHGQNDSGDKVIIKDNRLNSPERPHSATIYHNLAKNFFGLGDHVPNTAVVSHPQLFGGHPTTIMQNLGADSALSRPEKFYEAANQGRADGSLHKLALMDLITGNGDRWVGNNMVHGGKVVNIDNDTPFNFSNTAPADYLQPSHPDLGYEGLVNDIPHIEANRWLQSLDKKKYVRELAKYGLGPEAIKHSVARLHLAKLMAKKGATIGQMHQAFHPQAGQYA